MEYKALGHNDIHNKVADRFTLKFHGFTENDLDKEFIVYTENIEVRLT